MKIALSKATQEDKNIIRKGLGDDPNMLINQAFRYELKPNVSRRILLAKHAGAARFAYNWGLKLRIEKYEATKTSTNAIEQHKLLNSLKANHFPWLYEVSKCAPQEALRDLDKAFAHFFRGLKTGRKVGFPTFKKKGSHDSFRLTGVIKIEGKSIQLPRLGKLHLKEISQLEGKILSVTVKREADRWFASLTVEREIQDPLVIEGEPIGLDLGLTSFAVLSNGEKIEAPKPLAKNLRRLKRASKRHSKKVLGSKNRKKSALRLSGLHRKCRNIRKNFLHKESTKLAKTKPVIVVEDLDVKKMLTNRTLSRSISDAGWSEFRRMLEYKTTWYGSRLVVAPRFYPSSKCCSCCGTQKSHLPLQVRKWQCMHCHTIHDRDLNAAKNLLSLSTESSSGIYACGKSSGEVNQQFTSHGLLKQELMNGIFVHKL